MGLFNRKRNDQPGEATLDVRNGAVIDLREEPRPVWGFPTKCPECADFGYLDRIDVTAEVMYQHCPSCWAKWETHRSATVDA